MYIERNCELIQEFHHAHPEVKCRLNRIYNSSFPGSVLWDFNSESFNQFVNSWSVSVRHMWDLPYATHKYFIEPLGGQHALTMMIIRYIKFLHSIKKSQKIAAQYLLGKVLRNCNTLTGRNVRYVLDKTSADDIFKINLTNVKKSIKFSEIPQHDRWRLNFVKELVNLKNENLELEEDENDENNFTTEELEEILLYLCTT